jgi:hypothetical protein
MHSISAILTRYEQEIEEPTYTAQDAAHKNDELVT